MRSFIFTVTSVSLGVAAHLVGGGISPGAHIILPLGLVIWVCAEAFAASERRGLGLFAGVLITQALVHLSLLGSGMQASTHGPVMAAMATGTGSTTSMPLLETPRMLAAHIAAGAAVAVLLRHAEAGLWRMHRWVQAHLGGPAGQLRPATLIGSGRRVTAERAPWRPHGLMLATAQQRRGPPRPRPA